MDNDVDMAMETETHFITDFHNLKGNSKSERTKNLYKLIRKPSLFLNEHQLNDTLKQLKPSTYQENLFYVDILIYFKRIDKLLEIFQQGNEIYTSKILKQPWMFEQAFKEIKVDKFVDEFLPCLSFSVRKKLLKRISRYWPEEKMDVLFDALYLKYGLQSAVSIFTKCTATKIKTVLQDNELTVSPVQLIEIYNKSEDIFLYYLNNNKEHFDTNYKKVIQYIAEKNPRHYIQLEKNDKISPVCKFGKRTTKLLLNEVKNDIDSVSNHYIHMLNQPVVIRKLGRHSDIIFRNHFPLDSESIWTHWIVDDLLQYYPKSRRWDLFLQTFHDNCPGIDLNKIFLSVYKYRLDRLYPPTNIFIKWAEVNYQNGKYMSYLKYFEINRAIDIIRTKITNTSNSAEKRELLILMVSVCHEQNNMVALEDVLQFICLRHKEDYYYTKQEILEKLNKCNIDDFNVNHWKYITILIENLRSAGKLEYCHLLQLMEKQIEFLFKTGKDYNQFLKDYMVKFNCAFSYLKNPSVLNKIYTAACGLFIETMDIQELPYHQSTFLLNVLDFSLNNPEHFIKLTDFPRHTTFIQKCFGKTKHFNYYTVQLVPKVVLYNLKFPENAVPLNSNFLTTLSLITEQEKCLSAFLIIIDDILSKKRCNVADSVMAFYFETFLNEYPKTHIIDWYLKNEPENLVPYLGKIFENNVMVVNIVNDSVEVFTRKDRNIVVNDILLQYFEYLLAMYPSRRIVYWFLRNEPNTLVPYFESIAKCSINYTALLDYNLVKHYSHFRFDAIIIRIYKDKLDERDVDNNINIINALRALLSTEEFLKVVEDRYVPKKDKLDLEDEEMCKVFHLQCEVAKVLAKVPEPYKMLPIIFEFCKGDYLQSALRSLYRAFYRSPEKLLYPYAEILSKRAVSVRKHAIFLSCEVLNKNHALKMLIGTDEKNVSSNKYHFSATLKFFLKNPSEDLLDKVFESIDKTDKNDIETLEALCEANVSKKYFVQYFEHCWKFFEKIESNGVNVDEYLAKLLLLIVTFIDDETSVSLNFITNVINRYLHNSTLTICCYQLILKVLETHVSERIQIFNSLFNILTTLPKVLSVKFLECLIKSALKRTIGNDVVSLFHNYWVCHFNITIGFQEHVLLELVLLKIKSQSTADYAISVVDYLDKLITIYGYHIYDKFKKAFLNVGFDSNFEQYSFYSAVLNYQVNTVTCVFVLDIIKPVQYGHDIRCVKLHKSIMETLNGVETPIVGVYFEKYLKNNQVSIKTGKLFRR